MRRFPTLAIVSCVGLLAVTVHGELGGFEPADGYTSPPPPVPANVDGRRVWQYDAGASGAPIAPNTGLWQNLDPVTGVPFVGYTLPPGQSYTTYVIAHPNELTIEAHSGAQMLALRHDTANSAQDNGATFTRTRYTFDGTDFASIDNAGTFVWSIWICALQATPVAGDGTDPEVAFYWRFFSSNGDVLLDFGWDEDNDTPTYLYRLSPADPWTTASGAFAPKDEYDELLVFFDFVNDTIRVVVDDVEGSGQVELVPLSPFAVGDALDLGYLDWFLDFENFKATFDDSCFVPELPATCFEPGPVCPWDCGKNGDDELVNIIDLLTLLLEWGQTTDCDFNGNGVDVSDLIALIAAWGPCPQP